jgi:hypothetical protein
MQNLKDQLLRAGLASKEQVQQAEEERQQQAALAKFQRTGQLRDFVTAYPKWKDGFRGLPPDTPVVIYEELEHKMLWARWPQRGRKLETGYGSPYLGTTLVVRVDKHTGEVKRTPIEPDDTGKRVSAIGDGFACDVAVVEQHEKDIEVFVRLV